MPKFLMTSLSRLVHVFLVQGKEIGWRRRDIHLIAAWSHDNHDSDHEET
jgi:hypothetical protein